MTDTLQKIYYTPESASAFSGRDNVIREGKKENVDGKAAKSWLNDQLTYSLHYPARRRFPRNKFFVRTPGELAQADICDLSMFSQQNRGFKYLLTFIDVFSKLAFVVPLKTKSGPEVLKAFLVIFKKFRPQSLQTDRGKEFVNKQFKDLCQKEGINLFFTYNQTVKCAVVERFNRTLKGRMFKYFTSKGTRKYIDVLDKLVDGYNKSFHRTIKMAPIEVNSSNTLKVFENTYGEASPSDYIENRENKEKTRFRIGDNVRVSYVVGPLDKGFYPNWTDEIFTITGVSEGNERDMYELVDEKKVKMPRRFYSFELQKVPDNPTYRIEKIIKQGKKKSLVKWLNYPSSYNSWVNNSDIHHVGG